MLGLGFGLSLTSQSLRGLAWPGNSTPTGLPTISGTAAQGQTLTVSTAGIADTDGLGTFAYQWLRAGSPIGGATSTTYVLQAADVGSAISVRVSYTDGMGKPESLTSAATAVVTGSAGWTVPGLSGSYTVTFDVINAAGGTVTVPQQVRDGADVLYNPM